MTDRRPQPLECVWMDLKTSVDVAEVPSLFERRCNVQRSAGFDGVAVERSNPDLVVLEFDYPSRRDLARAASFKRHFASVPMIVVTVQHSVSLAVWCFRSKFYDFLARPLAAVEVNRSLDEIHSIRGLRSRQAPREIASARQEVPAEAGSQTGERARLQPALNLVERNYHQRLLVTDVAEQCGLPPFRFGRIFKEQFGVDFREYVLRYRIREACRLLRNPRASIAEVGYSVGFSEPSYFARMFKKLTGRCPSDIVGLDDFDYKCIDTTRA